jgi:hypothetical protein
MQFYFISKTQITLELVRRSNYVEASTLKQARLKKAIRKPLNVFLKIQVIFCSIIERGQN